LGLGGGGLGGRGETGLPERRYEEKDSSQCRSVRVPVLLATLPPSLSMPGGPPRPGDVSGSSCGREICRRGEPL
jgi:hypothetical protein